MERRRGHFIVIFDDMIKYLFTFLILLVIGLEGENYFYLAIAFFGPILSLLKYFNTYYSIKKDMFVIESGIFTKTKTEIPLSLITTVDLTQNLLYQVFHIQKVKIDNSSKSKENVNKAELTIALKNDEALKIKELLLSKAKTGQPAIEKESVKPEIKTKFSDFLLLGLLQSKLAYIAAAAPVTMALIGLFMPENEIDSSGIKATDAFMSLFQGIPFVAAIVIIILSIITVSFILSLLFSLITYYNFKLSSSKEAIHIEYGLLNKKSYTLMKSSINGVSLKQPLLMRLLGYCTIEVYIFGYGNDEEDKKEISMLYPIARLSETEALLKNLLPELKPAKQIKKPEKKAFRYFFYNFKTVFGCVLLTGACFSRQPVFIGIAFAVLGLIIISCIMQYFNTGLNINQLTITAVSGSFTKKTTLIRTKAIESIYEKSGLFKRKKGISNIGFQYIGPKMFSTIVVKNATIQQYEDAKAALTY